MTEGVDKNLQETILAGTLDALANRDEMAHAGQAYGVTQRPRITYNYSVQGVKVYQTVFFSSHTAVAVTH